MVHQSFRRMVVIKTEDDSSFCCPISTYGGRGCTKTGHRRKTHGIVHDTQYEPMLLKGEKKLGVEPVGVVMYGEHTLSQESRVNYGKGFWVQHNVPVMFIGKIPTDQMKLVKRAVRHSLMEDSEDETVQAKPLRRFKHKSEHDAFLDDADTASQGKKEGESSKSRHKGH